VGAFSAGLIGVSAMASVFVTEIRHNTVIVIINSNNTSTLICCIYT